MFRFQTISLWWRNLGMPPIKSTAATYTKRSVRKTCCLNKLLYNWWKYFKINSEILFSVCSLISSSSPPIENFKNSPFPLFFFPLDFEKFQFPADSKGGSRYVNVDKIVFIAFNTFSGFFYQFEACIISCFHV